ncbi:aldehyde dehydrogenase family protein [Natronolimnohabitans innermongolicus]|uniref:Aldehyde Dehydrogenase n=1 Tax=Natronolimnohabitans innermongolicus JCM 12255 TaxID=1227499 RepID=L9XAW6_9EURY|nr:aldehyde dehydrogenase family protein [Natronolimnohabitans innermongolicus]ELY57763.1 Aldehyde Dehydrogenase [Natronolimnohabitans innermongolicus JCM 12255]
MSREELEPEADWSQLYIDGEWRDAASGETIPVENPAKQDAFTSVPAATEDDVDAAYDAAEAAQPEWAARSREERNEIVENLLEAVNTSFDEITSMLATEAGTPSFRAMAEFATAKGDVEMALELEAPEEEVRPSTSIDDKENHIVYEPVGVVGVISPWNFPFHLSLRALAPAIALGNTVVLKPASDTPISGGLLIAKLCAEAGVPDGVVNVVTGRGSDIGDRMTGHPTPRVLSFTGSTSVGKGVAKSAGENLALPALELGGNAPFVVTDEADLEQAARAGAFGSFFHQGQVCISINRHLVHEELYDEYVDLLVDHAESLYVGDPSEDSDVTFGPVQNETQRDDLVRFIEKTVDAGATLETGGEADGLFVEPTVLSECTNDMPTACNEHFGPVAPVIPFSDDEEAVELANDTEYGLSAAVFCEDEDRARDLADRIEAGMVHINDQPINEDHNAPFGGVKNSGLGRYHGEWIVGELTEPKWISVQNDDRDYLVF